MSLVDEARTQLQARAKPSAGTPASSWSFPDIYDDLLGRHKVLAFDGTLTNCGWVVMEVSKGKIAVLDKGTLKPRTHRTGYHETWDKAGILERMLNQPHLVSYLRQADGIVAESPAVRGSRIESSLIAGLLVMLWCRDYADFCDVSATHVSKVLLGESRVLSAERKKRIREAVIRLYPDAATGWNEHERDALATGAVHLYDLKRRQDEH